MNYKREECVLILERCICVVMLEFEIYECVC